MKYQIVTHILSASFLIAFSHITAFSGNLTNFVNPKIGTAGHGHVFVGANVPSGMVQLGPTSIPQDWDWCSGYHASDSTVIGFSHTHLSGTGIGDLFDITVMPVTGHPRYSRGFEPDYNSGLWSYADRSREIARPGYYSVPLERYGILAELTASSRVGMHRYTFSDTEDAAVIIDLLNGGCWDSPMFADFIVENDSCISGYRFSRGWAANQKVYFTIEFSRPFSEFSLQGPTDLYGRADFDIPPGGELLMKVALSPTSIDGAKKNMAAEIPGWDFDAVSRQADQEWEAALSRVKIEAEDPDVLKNFYSGLYHLLIAPVQFSDVDGTYRGADYKLHKAEGFTPYTILSLWDTYRAALPLMSIAYPDLYRDVVNTMVDIGEKQGRLPVWHLWGNETDCMVGNPGVIAVASAVANATPGVDSQRAMAQLLATSNDTIRGLAQRHKYGFIPSDTMNESIAFDLEYAIADAAVADAAIALGLDSVAADFRRRSKSYRHYYDPSTGFLRGKMTDGSLRSPFDPYSSSHRIDDYCEGNAWTYLWLVPHDTQGLQELMGGKEAMLQRLDTLFVLPSEITGEASPDISGLIGQYAHGNEPGHHIPYLYAKLGEPEKGNSLIRRVLDEMYSPTQAGLCGNEDCGQMSAWYILSALGFYPLMPSEGVYMLGSPVIDRAEIATQGGILTIEVVNNSKENINIESIEYNGKPYPYPYLRHADLTAGGSFKITMKE